MNYHWFKGWWDFLQDHKNKFIVFNSCKILNTSLPHGMMVHWMSIKPYFFCVQFLLLISSQNKQTDLLYGALAQCWLQYVTLYAMSGQQMYLDIIQLAKSMPSQTTEWPASDCHHGWYSHCASVRQLSLTQQLCNHFCKMWFSSLGYWDFLARDLLLNRSGNRGQRQTCI